MYRFELRALGTDSLNGLGDAGNGSFRTDGPHTGGSKGHGGETGKVIRESKALV